MSASVKFEEDSERVKVREVVSPALSEARSEVRVIEGLIVSMERMRELFESAPSTLKLPDLSVNLELATEIRASVALSDVGVKIAV